MLELGGVLIRCEDEEELVSLMASTWPIGVVPAGHLAGGTAYFPGSQHMAPGGAQGSGSGW